jgi:tetratricopeptide (TPR) repeat protein
MDEAERLLKSIEAPLLRHELDAAGKRKARAAEKALRKALEDPALRPRALVRLGWLLRWVGELDEAGALFDEALGTAEWLEATREKADLDLMRARLPQAIALLRRGLEREPDDADLNTRLGTCLYYEKDVDGAIAALERAPGVPEAVALLNMIRRERSAPPEAPSEPSPEALDRALERALELIRASDRTPEEKADVEAKLREARRRSGE